MQLKNLIVIPPKIEFGEALQAIETAIPPLGIEQAIEHTQSKQQRNRILPTHVIVALVIAMNLWSKDSIEDAFQNLVQGLSSAWIRLGQRWQRPSKSSLSEARQRVDSEPEVIPEARVARL